ncbi:diguanylate cyclase (GGDEF) domain-containing protein [Marinobacterium lutimaris]|uniref:diguanylate cyclase n=1 Tax=Marinobacterium lutimaris TaxID=568106 RepID=A0A1H6AU91_9GAMM|nr:diguanylate cyclase (GGDEF) domain-containing protein [Marinobacterium lutimaris]
MLLIVAAGAIGTWQAYSVSRLLEQTRQDETLRDLAQVQAFRAQDLFSDAERVLEAFQALFRASEYVSMDEFREFAGILLPGRDDLYAVHWAPKIALEEVAAHEARLRSRGLAPGGIFEFVLPSMEPVSVAPRPFYFPITHSEPLERNRDVIGLDVAVRFGGAGAPLEMARQGRVYTSSAFPIAQDRDGPLGVAVFQPVRFSGSEPWSLQQLRGFLMLLLRPGISLTERLEPIKGQSYEMRLIDISDTKPEQIYPREAHDWPTGPEYSFPLKLGSRQWQIDIAFDAPSSFSIVPAAVASLVAILTLVIILALERSFRQSSALLTANCKLSQLANSDPLTGLANRRRIEERAAEVFALEVRDGSFSAVCVVDLDNFKQVNDSFGHQRGDHLLIELAELFRRSIRGGDVAARTGGDEFVLLMPQLRSLGDVTVMLDRLLESMNMAVEGLNKTEWVSASVGVALSEAGCRDFETLQQRADRAMYAAKRAGKNRYMIWSAELMRAQS